MKHMDPEKVKSLTLRTAVFFGLSTFVLCISIFYIQGLLEDTQMIIDEKEKIIKEQELIIKDRDRVIRTKNNEIKTLKEDQLMYDSTGFDNGEIPSME